MKITVGSDFSGVGALNQALKKCGINYKKVFACDKDVYVRESYLANYEAPDYFPENVYDRVIPESSLDLYSSSPPCQPFSWAGERQGERDDRGILFYNSLEFISKNKPRFFIFENVEGLKTNNRKYKGDDLGQTFQAWLTLLGGKSVNGVPVFFPHPDSVPYHVYWTVLNAMDYNVPQNRKRLFVVGIRDDKDNDFEFPKPQPLQVKLKDLLDLNASKKYIMSEKRIGSLVESMTAHESKGNGFKLGLLSIESLYANTILNPSKDRLTDNYVLVKSGTEQGFELAEVGDCINFAFPKNFTKRGRVARNVSNTIDTLCTLGVLQKYSDKRRTKNKYYVRRFTPRECFRLMGFPDDFKFVCSDTQLYKQAGNSVVTDVYAAIINKLKF